MTYLSAEILSVFGLVYLLDEVRVASLHLPLTALLCSTSFKKSGMDPQPAVVDEFFCSKCAKSRATEEFEINKQGKRKKTCKRHMRKRSLEFDNWENFMMLLQRWNQPVRNIEPLNVPGLSNPFRIGPM